MEAPPTDRWRERLYIIRPVAAAVAIAFTLDVVLTRPSLGGVAAAVFAYLISATFFFFLGRWFGKHTWPKRGRKMARAMLRRRVARGKEFLFLSDRPDARRSTPQRMWEGFAFAAGGSLLFTTILSALGLPPLSLFTAGFLVPVTMVAVSFVLVPYWLFSRLGIRIVEPVRWLILPLSRQYADRLKLSNGFLILLATGASLNLAFRSGAKDFQALSGVLSYILRIAGVVLVISATAVAYYNREERRVAHELEQEAIQMGIRDGRGMTDGDFLPRLPTPKG